MTTKQNTQDTYERKNKTDINKQQNRRAKKKRVSPAPWVRSRGQGKPPSRPRPSTRRTSHRAALADRASARACNISATTVIEKNNEKSENVSNINMGKIKKTGPITRTRIQGGRRTREKKGAMLGRLGGLAILDRLHMPHPSTALPTVEHDPKHQHIKPITAPPPLSTLTVPRQCSEPPSPKKQKTTPNRVLLHLFNPWLLFLL